MSEGPRRRVTYSQLETLWEFLNEHRDVATGFNKTARARESSKRLWQTAAQTLNAQGNGAIKDWKGWNKYWNDYKSKLKKAVASNRTSMQRTGGGPSEVVPLPEIERKFLQILGESFGSGLPGVRVEPFEQVAEVEMEGAPPQNVESNDLVILENIVSSAPSSPVPQLIWESSPQEQPASEPEASQRVSPQPQISGNNPRSSRRTPPSRRARRREPPQSQEATRRSLVAISEQRNLVDLARNELLRELIQEIRELKEILRNRLPLLDTPILDELQ